MSYPVLKRPNHATGTHRTCGYARWSSLLPGTQMPTMIIAYLFSKVELALCMMDLQPSSLPYFSSYACRAGALHQWGHIPMLPQ